MADCNISNNVDPHKKVMSDNRYQIVDNQPGIFSRLYSHLRWTPTSHDELAQVEAKILSVLKRPFKTYFVDIGEGWGKDSNNIRTIEMIHEGHDENQKHDKVPLLMVHGFASGIGGWILNLDPLASSIDRKIFAFDILGFGRSSRPKIHNSDDVEGEFVDSIERWRQAQKIDKFILLGHSFGGYLSANYALKYPERVAHMILADPWGIQDKDFSTSKKLPRFPFLLRALNQVFKYFAPLAIIRVTGPYGPRLIHMARNDLKEKFRPILGDECSTFIDYIYHCNAQSPSGEIAFKTLVLPYGWPKRPLIYKFHELDPSVSMTFIYGARSWIESTPGEYLKDTLGAERVSVNTIQGSGHHVYADRFGEFNDLVKEACGKIPE